MGKVFSTLVTVVVAVGASAAVWVGANLLFNQTRSHWRRFTAIAFGLVGFLLAAVLHGNRVTRGSGEGFLTWIWLPVVAGVVFAAVGLVLEATSDPRRRQVIGVVAGVGVGVAIALMIRREWHPDLDWPAFAIWTLAIAAVGAGLNRVRRRAIAHGASVGGVIGAVLGGWGSADLGSGSIGGAMIASIVPAAIAGVRLGATTNPGLQARGQISNRSRGVIFLAPALLFILVALIIPAIRTMYLSLYDARSEKFVDLANYGATFTDPTSWDASKWTNMFTSRLFFIGMAMLLIALAVGIVAKRRTGRAVEIGNPTVAPLVLGFFLVAFAAFTSFRGTIINNLWWVLTVVFASTAMGLAVAVLADKARSEKVAKSLIFLPLAISLVGASVIWRFVYVPRDISIPQTGVLNALWVGLGRLSTGSGIPTLVVAVVLAAVLIGMLVLIARSLVRRDYARSVIPGVVLVLLGWFFVRYIGSGVGGYSVLENGTIVPRKIDFVQESPFNNVFLMVILIWMQTGFAMVILSAAIKAVPEELIEAARVDGASPSQIFWRVTLPQISTTIGVVVTTLIVLVMKVFDIVKVVTNGNFGTQVLANDMYNQAFQFGNIGRGAALAIILFLSVVPVMFFNIRRMQRNS